MSETWQRQTMLEDAFLDMHKIKPEVYYQRINRNTYKIKLVYSNKEAILMEVLKNGLPDVVTMEYGGETKNYKCMYDAEMDAVSKFKG